MSCAAPPAAAFRDYINFRATALMPRWPSAENSGSMASYWIVVRRDNIELLEILSVAFRGRTGFDVVADRRTNPSRRRRGPAERRGPQMLFGPDEFIVAERVESPFSVC